MGSYLQEYLNVHVYMYMYMYVWMYITQEIDRHRDATVEVSIRLQEHPLRGPASSKKDGCRMRAPIS